MLTFRFRQWPILFKIMAISVISVTFITLVIPVSYTHLRAHETKANLVCRLLLEKKKQ